MAFILLAAVLLAATVAATPTPQTGGEPATVYFTPYPQSGCNGNAGQQYAVSTGPCYSMDFESYSEYTNFVSTIPCVLSIYPEADCQGQGQAATLSYQAPQCTTQCGKSFELVCGP